VNREIVLILMAKQPSVGRTKTRLCPPLSLAEAAAFYEAMLLDTLALAGSLTEAQLAAAVTPAAAQEYFETITPPGTLVYPVEGENLGECLLKTMQTAFNAGFKKVLVLNTDGPSLPQPYLIQALEFLETNDLVLGPGQDGGYYLIGMKCPHPQIFQDISWSTDQVLEQSLARANSLGLSTALTPSWYDVDTVVDAARLVYELSALPPERLVHTRSFLETLPVQVWES
jgi:uncharacterized protein